jgi:hypothetical protein
VAAHVGNVGRQRLGGCLGRGHAAGEIGVLPGAALGTGSFEPRQAIR